MNLRELKNAVDNAIESAADHGEKPEEIPVTLQIDGMAGMDEDYACSVDVELHYDGNAQASGCVLQGWAEREGIVDVLVDAGYEVVTGADGVRAMMADKGDGSTQPRCSGLRVFPDGEKCAGCGDCKPNILLAQNQAGEEAQHGASCENCGNGPRCYGDALEAWRNEDPERYRPHPCQYCMRNQPYADNWRPKMPPTQNQAGECAGRGEERTR